MTFAQILFLLPQVGTTNARANPVLAITGWNNKRTCEEERQQTHGLGGGSEALVGASGRGAAASEPAASEFVA